MCKHTGILGAPCQPCALADKEAHEKTAYCPRHPDVLKAKYHNECAACVKSRAKGEGMPGLACLDMDAIHANAYRAGRLIMNSTPEDREAAKLLAMSLVDPDGTAFGKQVGGSHYTDMKIQLFQFSMANGLNPLEHTAIKYIARRKPESRIQDLEKAIHTIQLLIEWEKENVKD